MLLLLLLVVLPGVAFFSFLMFGETTHIHIHIQPNQSCAMKAPPLALPALPVEVREILSKSNPNYPIFYRDESFLERRS
uniref:Putative secreted peptide n=1 Tax=Anopheles braziliensis TaxID=58242 RepID=A0A2M3ZQ19_9DIPT